MIQKYFINYRIIKQFILLMLKLVAHNYIKADAFECKPIFCILQLINI